MKTLSLLMLLLTNGWGVMAQDEITKANDCFNKADYTCAVDFYKMGLEKKGYKEGQAYRVEFRIAESYYRMKQYELAIEFYKKSAAHNPNDVQTPFAIGDGYYNLGKYSEAIAAYTNALALNPATDQKDKLYYWVGKSYYGQKKYSDAIIHYKKIGDFSTAINNRDLCLGDCFYFNLKYDSAIYYYNMALINPEKKQSRSTIFSTKYYMGRCKRLLGKYDEAIEIQNKILADSSTHADAMWEIGINYISKKNYPAAIEWYTKSFNTNAFDSSDTYTLANNIANSHINMGNYAEAIRWLEKRKAVSKNKYAEIATIASYQFGKLKQQKLAEKLCTEAIDNYALETAETKATAKFNLVKLHTIVGKCALARRDTSSAIKNFEAAMALDKYNYEANWGLAELAWTKKNEEVYIKMYTNMYKTSFDTLLSTDKEIACVYGRRAYISAQLKNEASYKYMYDLKDALKYDSLQKEAIAVWPNYFLSLPTGEQTSNRQFCVTILNKGIKQYATDKQYASDLHNRKAVVLDSKDTGAILKSLKDAITIFPENFSAWDNVLKYYSSYDNVTGLAMSDKLITLLQKKKENLSMANAYVCKGDFYWRLGKKEEAKNAYQQALVWDANNATAKERSKLQ